MDTTTSELYERAIKPLPAAERLRLATLILTDIPPHSVVDDRDDWSEEDLREFTQLSRSRWEAREEADAETR
jgi:hypothetical protein